MSNARHTAHFCVEEQIFERMCFIHKQTVYAQFLKRHHIVLFLLRRQLFQFSLQIFLGFFHLLDGKVIAVFLFRALNRGYNFVNLVPDDGALPFGRERNLLKLAVADDNSVIVSGGDPGAELLAAVGFKVLLGGHQHLRAGIQAQKIAAPLFRQVVRDDE